MRPRRVRFTIRGLMIAVLVVAILLSMPIRDAILLDPLVRRFWPSCFFVPIDWRSRPMVGNDRFGAPVVKYSWNGQTRAGCGCDAVRVE